MNKLDELPETIALAQEDLLTLKRNLDLSEESTEQAEATVRLQVEGKNAELRAAMFTALTAKSESYQAALRRLRFDEQALAERRLQVEALEREYGAVCHMAGLHAAYLGFVAHAPQATVSAETLESMGL
jgi:hypothetical protein